MRLRDEDFEKAVVAAVLVRKLKSQMSEEIFYSLKNIGLTTKKKVFEEAAVVAAVVVRKLS